MNSEKRDFNERNEWGGPAVEKTIKILRYENIRCELTVIYNNYKELKELRDKDLKYGDLFILNRFYCDVKRDKISKKSLLNFQGDFFILWRMSLEECIVIKREDIKNLNLNNYTHLVMSGDEGFTFEQLQKLPHQTLDEFIKWLKII